MPLQLGKHLLERPRRAIFVDISLLNMYNRKTALRLSEVLRYALEDVEVEAVFSNR